MMEVLSIIPSRSLSQPHIDQALIDQTLSDVFGFESFRPGQAEVVQHVVQGHSSLAVFPTGSGKSLCFQLSALLCEGTALVVSPLMALMKDQVDFLVEHKVPAARLDSSLSLEEYRQVQSDLRNDKLKLLYVSPERFSNEKFITSLEKVKLSFMVIDEVHCISEWGHNFRPDYLKLAQAMKTLGISQVLGLTATATPAVVQDICKTFDIHRDHYVHTGFYRPNLTLTTEPTELDMRTHALRYEINQHPRGATIVYVTLQATAEKVATELSNHGLTARAYHAGMDNDVRAQTQDWFMKEAQPIVVATIAFGMGIDKSDIRYVYHYNLPKSLENYSQEIGRAGRDGRDSRCSILGDPSDLTILENFVYGDTPSTHDLQCAIETIAKQENTEFGLSTYHLSNDHDIRPLVVSTLLTYLELEGLMESTGAYYNSYKYQPLVSSSQMLAGLSGEPKNFLQRLIKTSISARTWFTIDIKRSMSSLQCPRERITKAMSYLEEKQFITLQPKELHQGYRLLKRLDETELQDLYQRMEARFQQREASDLKRIELVRELLLQQNCRVKHLLHYFGEMKEDDCGHCDVCLDEVSECPPSESPSELTAQQIQVLRSIANSSNYDKLETARSITRFACGIRSPIISKQRLSSHKSFGALEDLPFDLVLKEVQAMGLREF